LGSSPLFRSDLAVNFPEIKTWIANRPELSGIADGKFVHDPNTGKTLTESRSSSPEQVDRAIAAAHAQYESAEWFRLGVAGRAPYLRVLAGCLDAVAEEIAHLDALNSGVPISITRLFSASNGETVRSATNRAIAAGDSSLLPAERREVRVHLIPWGATAIILPWNAPAPMMVKKLAFALAAGSAVVVKPSPESPGSAQIIAEAVAAAGIPAGVVNVVTGGGVVGAQLSADSRIRAIAMTGSTATGRLIAASAAPRFARLHLELGSNNAAIIRADANIAHSATAIVGGALKLSGQWCEAPRRVVVDSAVIQDFASAVVSEMAAWRVGSSLDEATELGPVAFRARRDQLLAQRQQLRADGCEIITVGPSHSDGWFFEPTIAVGAHNALPSEIFGPMLVLEPSSGDTDAVQKANDGNVGLAGYVFSSNETAARDIGLQLNVGEVKVNGTSVLDMAAESSQSFFGSSGIGGHGDSDLLGFFTGKRILGTDSEGLPL
jgi:betaine-aldehyde dehydrogenase